MRHFYLLALILGTVFSGGVYASEEIKEYTYVAIWETDGTCNVYKSADHPVIVPSDEYLVLKVNDTEVMYPASKALKFTFSKTEDVDSSIDEVVAKGTYYVTQNSIDISGLDKKVAHASVYALDGKMMLRGKVADGGVTLDISGLVPGVYVVKCGDVNFKFLKK